jgi:hypothetical protein
MTYLEDMAMGDELTESHYLRLLWARATMETPVWIGDVQEPMFGVGRPQLGDQLDV